MKRMILISLLINVVVLIPVCVGLMLDAQWVTNGYGLASPARGILLSVYGAILLLSLGLLLKPLPILVAPLLLIQVLYKLTTPFTVGSFTNPIVFSNLIIALVHLITLYLILKELQDKIPSQTILEWK